MEKPEVNWRRGSAVGVAPAEFSTSGAADELDAVGYRLADTDQPVADEPVEPHDENCDGRRMDNETRGRLGIPATHQHLR